METQVSNVVVEAAAPEVKAPKAPKGIAQQNGEAQAKAITAALKTTYRPIAAAALALTKGNEKIALDLVGGKVKGDVRTIAYIVPLLNSPCPAAMFTDGKSRQGVTVGALFGSALGLSAVVRGIVKASLKEAREHLIDMD